MKILFISRSYPPSVGGIQNQNFKLCRYLSKSAETTVIANKFGKIFLPLFLPYAFVKSLILGLLGRYDIIILGDGLLGVVGWLLKIFIKKPVICVVHGLDLTYNNRVYQKLWIGVFLRKTDKLVAVSNATMQMCVDKGLTRDKIVFIPNGADEEDVAGTYSKEELAKIAGPDISGKKVLLTVGRLVTRKGVAWFIENVMTKLNGKIVYLIAGEGPEMKKIKKSAIKNGLKSEVRILGRVSEHGKRVLLNTCDIFVQPNIKVEGDMEGFGISVLEAALCKKPIVASNLEGLRDAIKDGQNGFLVKPQDSSGFVSKIEELLDSDSLSEEAGASAKDYVVANYNWAKISGKYFEVIKATVKS